MLRNFLERLKNRAGTNTPDDPAGKISNAADAAVSTLISQEETEGAEMPYGTKISKLSREGIEFYWKKPERAGGYEVFRSYSPDGPFDSIALIEVRSRGEYTDAEFDHSLRRIYYSVRSFINNDDGTRSFSTMTEPVAAVFREEMAPERKVTYMYSGSERHIMALYGWGEAEDPEWSSADISVAEISPDGTIHAVSKGECDIICRSGSTGLECRSRVVVDREPTEPLQPENPRFHYDAETGMWSNPDAENTGRAVIMMAGDMMCGSAQMRRQYSEERGWVFNESFEYVRPVTARSDFAIANLETLMASPWPYMVDESFIDNKNNCNAPARYLDAVRYGGFDAVSMSNNHNCDGGVRALMDTIDQVEKYEFPYTGVFRTAEDRHFMIVNVNGIKVGFLAYMSAKTTFNGKDANWTRQEKMTHLNVYTDAKGVRDVRACRDAGAEYVIAYMHWGVKNFRNITEDQQRLAQSIADAGADLIIGANPHIVQIYDEIETPDGRSVPCYYSTGNFQAKMNQIPGNRDSIMVRIILERNSDGSIVLKDNGYIAFHCYDKIDGRLWATAPMRNKYNTSPRKSASIHKRINASVGDKGREV